MTPLRQNSSFKHLSPSELSLQCRRKRADNSHEAFCIELFRRAIDRDCASCWTDIYEIYYRLLRLWIIQSAADPTLAAYPVDELAQNAFTHFWRYYTSDKLARAKGLGHILKYLKSCAVTAVAQARRNDAAGCRTFGALFGLPPKIGRYARRRTNAATKIVPL